MYIFFHSFCCRTRNVYSERLVIKTEAHYNEAPVEKGQGTVKTHSFMTVNCYELTFSKTCMDKI